MLRARLVLWYAFLVVLTVIAVGTMQYILLYRSLTGELDNSLLDNAKTGLRLITSRPGKHVVSANPHVPANYSNKTLKQLVDDAIREAPDCLTGQDLTDRVLSSLMDEMLGELSGKDSAVTDPFGALIERTLTTSHNYFIEVYPVLPDSSLGPPIFRTQNS